MAKLTDNQIEEIKRKKDRDVRIMTQRAQVRISSWSLPTIILLFAGLVYSIKTIKDASMIAVIASSVSSVSMALIGILQSMTGHKEREDPIVTIVKAQADANKSLVEQLKNDKSKSQSIRLGDKDVSLTEGTTNIHVSDDDVLWGKDKPKGDK